MFQRRRYFFISILLSISIIGVLYYSLLVQWVWIVMFLAAIISVYTLEESYVFPEQLFFGVFFLVIQAGYMIAIREIFTLTGAKDIHILILLGLVLSLLQYGVFLTLNIFNVATVKTVPLLKAAQATLTAFLIGTTVVWAYYVVVKIGDSPLLLLMSWVIYCSFMGMAYTYLNQIKVVEDFDKSVHVPTAEVAIMAGIQLCNILVLTGWGASVVVKIAFLAATFSVHNILIRYKMQRLLTNRGLRDFSVILFAFYFLIILNGMLG